MRKKVLLGLVSMAVVLVCSMTVFAEEDIIKKESLNEVSRGELESVAISLGIPESIVTDVPKEDLLDWYETHVNGEEIEVSTGVLIVDPLDEIQEFVEYGSEQMILEGADKSEVKDAQEKIDELFDMSDRELKKEEGLSNGEIKILREIEEEVEEECDNKECNVEASGELSQTTCSVIITKTSKATKKRPVQYDMKTVYSWKKVPFLTFTDKVVYAWGGNLNLDNKETSGKLSYYYLTNKGKNFEKHVNNTYNLASKEINEKIQKGCTFKIDLNKKGKVAKTGTMNARIYQTKKEGKESKLLVTYCHAKLAVGLGDISISKNPFSIKVGIGYDSTEPANKTFKY